MKRLGVTALFVEELGRIAAQQSEPAAFQQRILAAAHSVAAGHNPAWADYHPLHGAYAGYWSFKPLPQVLDFMVLCVPLTRILLLADLGAHKRFFTPGAKTAPPKTASLRLL